MKYLLFGNRYGAISRLNDLGANINTKNIGYGSDRIVILIYDSETNTYNGKDIKQLTVDDVVNKYWFLDLSIYQKEIDYKYYTIADYIDMIMNTDEYRLGIISTYESDVVRFTALTALLTGAKVDIKMINRMGWSACGSADMLNSIMDKKTPYLHMFHNENFRTLFKFYPLFKQDFSYLTKFIDAFLDEIDIVKDMDFDSFSKYISATRWRSTVDGWHYKMLFQSLKYNGIQKLDQDRLDKLNAVLESDFIKRINENSYNMGNGYQNKTYITIYENFNISANILDYILGNANIELSDELKEYFIEGFDESAQTFNSKFKSLSGINTFLISMKYSTFSGYSSNMNDRTRRFIKDNYTGLKTMNENIAKVINRNATSKQCANIVCSLRDIMGILFDWSLLDDLTLNICFPNGVTIGDFTYTPKKESEFAFILNSVKTNPLGLHGYIATILALSEDQIKESENEIAESLFKLISHDCTRYYGDWEFGSAYALIKDKLSDTKREFLLKAAFKYIESTNKTLLYRKYISFVKSIDEENNLPAEILKNKSIRKIIMESDLKE